MSNHTKKFLNDIQGATAIEYGLIAACIFLVMVVGFGIFSNKLTNSYNDTSAKVDAAMD